jgi:uncharacterized protein YjdB
MRMLRILGIIALLAGLTACPPTTPPVVKTTLTGTVKSQGLSVVDIDSIGLPHLQGIRGQGLSVVDIDSVRFDGTEVLAVRPDGTVVASSPFKVGPASLGAVGAQAGIELLSFNLSVPSGENVALVIANKGPSGKWVCQRELGYQDVASGRTTSWKPAFIKPTGSSQVVGSYGFNELNGALASDKSPSYGAVDDASFVADTYLKCGNSNVITSKVKIDYNFQAPDSVGGERGVLDYGLVLALDTSELGRNVAPAFRGSAAFSANGQVEISVRREKGAPLKLAPVITDICNFDATKCRYPITPADDRNQAAIDIPDAGKDFGSISQSFGVLRGQVLDKERNPLPNAFVFVQASRTARTTASLARGITTSGLIGQVTDPDNDPYPLTSDFTDSNGNYELLLPVSDEPYEVGALDNQGNIALVNGGEITITTPTDVGVPPIQVVPPTYPVNPSSFVATAPTFDTVNLAWDTAPNATGFYLERYFGEGSYTRIATLPATTLSYKDVRLNYNTTYYYRLIAFNRDGSAGGVETEVTTPFPTTSIIITGPKNVQIGEKVKFSAVVKGPQGEVIPDRAVTWSIGTLEPGLDNVVTISNQGEVVAKGFGPFEVRASADGITGALITRGYGLMLKAGTFNDISDGLQTLVLATLRPLDSNSNSQASINVSANGWNGGAVAPMQTNNFTVLPIVPVSGVYSAKLINGSPEVLGQATVNSNVRLAAADNINITRQTNSLTVTWDAIPAARHYYVSLDQSAVPQRQKIPNPNDSTVAFDNISADVPAKICVVAYNFAVEVDSIVFDSSGQINGSKRCQDSIPAPVLTALTPTSGPEAGGNTIKISGRYLSAGFVGVKFGNLTNIQTSNRTDSEITLVVPAGVGTVPVQVVTDFGESNLLSYRYLPPAPMVSATLSSHQADSQGEYKTTYSGASDLLAETDLLAPLPSTNLSQSAWQQLSQANGLVFGVARSQFEALDAFEIRGLWVNDGAGIATNLKLSGTVVNPDVLYDRRSLNILVLRPNANGFTIVCRLSASRTCSDATLTIKDNSDFTLNVASLKPNERILLETAVQGQVAGVGQFATTLDFVFNGENQQVQQNLSVNLSAAIPASITVGAMSKIKIGQTVKAEASVRNHANIVISGAAVAWSSSDPNIASVDATGNVTAKALGNVTITAQAGDVTGRADATTYGLVVQGGAISLTDDSEATTQQSIFHFNLSRLTAASVVSPTAISPSAINRVLALAKPSILAQATGSVSITGPGSWGSVVFNLLQGQQTVIVDRTPQAGNYLVQLTINGEIFVANFSVTDITPFPAVASIDTEANPDDSVTTTWPALAGAAGYQAFVQERDSKMVLDEQPFASATSADFDGLATLARQRPLEACVVAFDQAPNSNNSRMIRVSRRCSGIDVGPGPVAHLEIIAPVSANNGLELGVAYDFNTLVTDANNIVILGATVVWTSLDPDIATVTSDGIVTARRLGTVMLSVTVESFSDDYSNDSYGLQAVGGVVPVGSGSRMLHVATVFRDANGNGPGPNSLHITEPGVGEGGLDYMILSFDQQSSHVIPRMLPNAGIKNYAASTTIDGKTYETDFTVDLSPFFDISTPLNITVTPPKDSGIKDIAIDWSDWPGAAHYSIEVTGVTPEFFTDISTHTFEDVQLVLGSYSACLSAFDGEPFDTPPDQVNRSGANCQSFTIQPSCVVDSVLISGNDMIPLNTTSTLMAAVTLLPDNCGDDTVAWQSDNPGVATINAATGEITPMGLGTATITATSNEDSLVFDTLDITVVAPPCVVDSVLISGNDMIPLNTTPTFMAAVTLLPANCGDDTVTWQSDNPGVATINAATGEITPMGLGTATITATSNEDPLVFDTLDITVVAPPCVVDSVLISGSNTIAPEETAQLTAMVNRTPANCGLGTVTWSSNAPGTISVNSTTGLITANGSGTATITATSNEDPLVFGTLDVTVIEPCASVNSVMISGIGSIPINSTVMLVATVDRTPAECGNGTVTWSSSNPAVISIDPITGLATGHAGGAVVITAVSNDNPQVFGTFNAATD